MFNLSFSKIVSFCILLVIILPVFGQVDNETHSGNTSTGVTQGQSNSSFGYNSGYEIRLGATGATNNSLFGAFSGKSLNSGDRNLMFGVSAGYFNNGSNNVFLGYRSGYNATGSGNLFIGHEAGSNETGSNKLYIDNSSTATPLIYGDFASDILTVNGNLGVGTSNPSEKLHINGNLLTTGWLNIQNDYGLKNTGDNNHFFSNSDSYWKMQSKNGLELANNDGSRKAVLYHNGNSFGFLDAAEKWALQMVKDEYTAFRIDNDEKMRILSNGRVGIGTSNPSASLHVVGDIIASGTFVADGYNPSNWNDAFTWGNHNNTGYYKAGSEPDFGEGLNLRGLTPTIHLNDTDDGDEVSLHLNKNWFYILSHEDNSADSHSTGWDKNGAYWPFRINLTNDDLEIGGDTFIKEGDFYIESGDVGIGTTSPSEKLHVNGNLLTSGWLNIQNDYGLKNTGDNNHFFSNSDSYWKMQSKNGLELANNDGSRKAVLYHNGNSFGFLDAAEKWALEINKDNYTAFRVAGDEKLRINDNGRVGIGTTNPSASLHVVGDIMASGTFVADGYNPSNWNDAFSWGDHADFGYWQEGNDISVENITSLAQGTTTMGASSIAGFEFNSTLPLFYFNKPVRVDGGQIGSYDEDLQLQSNGVTEITVSNSSNLVTVDADMVLNGQLKLNPTSGIPNNNNYEDLLVVNGLGEMATRRVRSIESPWLYEKIFNGRDSIWAICPDTAVVSPVLVDVIDLNGNIKIGNAAYIDDDAQAGDNDPGYVTPDDWIKFTEEGYLGFKSADATRGMLLFDDDTQTQYLNLFHTGGTTSLSNGSNDFFLQSTGRNVTFGGSVSISTLAADRLEASDNMVFNFDRSHDVGTDYFQIERGGAGGLGLPVPLFKVDDSGNTRVLAGDFTVSGGHAFLSTEPDEDPALTQVVVRDPTAGQLKYRNASSFTPWSNNSTYLSYTGKIGINTSAEPTTDLEVNGSGKFNSLEVVDNGNAAQWYSAATTLSEKSGDWDDAFTERGSQIAGSGLSWDEATKDLSINIGSGLSFNASNQLEIDENDISIPATQVTGLPWDPSSGTLTYTGNAKVTGAFEAQNLKLTGLGVGDKSLDEVMVISDDGTVKSVLSSEFDTGVSSPWTISDGQLDYTGIVDVDGALASNSFNTGAGTFTNINTSNLQISGLISGATFSRVLMEDGAGNLGYKDLSSFNFSHWSKDASDNLRYESGTITSTQGIYSEVGASDLALVVKNGSTTNFKVNGAGNIRGRKLELDLQTSWPDYVFGEDYKLRSLEEVETYVKANKHLPDVPSEEEVRENGIDVAEMESVLLQKVEELTLYIIEQNKTIKSQQLELKQQKDDFAARLEALEQKIGH